MDLNMLLEKQEKLDNEILKNAGIKKYPFENIQLALLVELGELANEWQGFKYWKQNKNIDRERLLDEFADCMHFALSLENHNHQLSKAKLKDFPEGFEKTYEESKNCPELDINDAFLNTYVCTLNNHFPIGGVLALGGCLDITPDEMQESYLKKYEVNIKRQQEGY